MKLALILAAVMLLVPEAQAQEKSSSLCPRGDYSIDSWSSKQPFLVAVAPIKSGRATLVKKGNDFIFECELISIPENPPQTTSRLSLFGIAANTVLHIEDANGRYSLSYNKESGATCWDNKGCEEASYCQKRSGQCAERGVCAKKPEICTAGEKLSTEYLPVIGCDGKNYGNACAAAAAGTSVKTVGTPKPVTPL